jgi:small-conductance mechanosensitive channel
MQNHHLKLIQTTAITFILFFLVASSAWSAGAQTVMAQSAKTDKAASQTSKTVELPAGLDSAGIDGIIASMSDEQVRRLLLQEMKKQAETDKALKSKEQEIGGLAGFIHRMRNQVIFLRSRIEFLKSGVDVGFADDVPGIFTYLGTGEHKSTPQRTIFSVVAVFAASFIIIWLFRRYTRTARHRVENHIPTGWVAKIGGLFFRSLLDLLSICLFVIATLVIYYGFLDRTTGQRVLIATYLVAFVIVFGVHLVSRFLLVPNVSALRFLPLKDDIAQYLHRWFMAIAIVGSFGMLTCGIYRLAGTSEADHFIMVTLVGKTMAIMLIWMILQKRKQVAQALVAGIPKDSLRAKLASYWQHFAIFGVLLISFFSTIQRLLLVPGHLAGIKTLLIIVFYLLLDWILRQILKVAFGIARQPGNFKTVIVTNALEETHAATDETVSSPEDEKTIDQEDKKEEAPKAVNGHLDINRMQRVLRGGLRIALAASAFFWIMSVWGIELPVGRSVADGTFDILITILICYVAWELINAAIQRRLALEMPESDDDMEEGGAGGSRIGTLLLLMRKFMLIVILVMVTMIILSRIGVDIGPLIAGAGVVGLAIGFGAQTLVRDIISGVFFLVDDAFRVGDYVSVGGTRGMVEHISIRSFKLRHPRGMVNTIPFGEIGQVTNYSRDYIITKLDFRVRYDADVEKIRKIIKKKVYKEILKNEELASKLLGKVKSQGVRQMDDSAMVMRVKYKTIPGEQFVIRKEVYRLMQEAFREEGIEFAHRNVTVYLPPDATQGSEGETDTSKRKALEAGAAAAAAAVQAEEDAQISKGGKK